MGRSVRPIGSGAAGRDQVVSISAGANGAAELLVGHARATVGVIPNAGQVVVLPGNPGVIFTDDFELGDPGAWSSVAP